jgi:hypothetical protein
MVPDPQFTVQVGKLGKHTNDNHDKIYMYDWAW